MKHLVTITLSIVFLISCGTTANDKAEALCNCYNEATRGKDRVDIMVDSCSQIYKTILTELEGNEEGKKEFSAAYDYCRNK